MLRHRSVPTTAIYAKVDHGALAQLAMPWPGSLSMSALRGHLDDYLALRRGLGFRLGGRPRCWRVRRLPGAGQRSRRSPPGTRWPGPRPRPAQPGLVASRLSAVRRFAAYLHPRPGAPRSRRPACSPARTRRAVPYLYSGEEVAALMAAARHIRTPLRAATYQALIGLLAVTGMRVGEAIGLDDGDLDAGQRAC